MVTSHSAVALKARGLSETRARPRRDRAQCPKSGLASPSEARIRIADSISSTTCPFTNMFDSTIGLQRFFTSDNFHKGVAFTNASHYTSPAIDQIFAAIAIAADVTKRKALIDQFWEIVAQDLPVMPLMLRRSLIIDNGKVIDQTVDATGVSGVFASLAQDLTPVSLPAQAVAS
jgi:ABC-type transport system substrate-binding protein